MEVGKIGEWFNIVRFSIIHERNMQKGKTNNKKGLK